MSYRQKVVTGKTQQVQRDSTHTQWSLSTQVIEAERQHPAKSSRDYRRDTHAETATISTSRITEK